MTALPAFGYRIVLDGTVYRVDFQWNARFQYWTFSIAANDSTPIVVGRKVVGGHAIFEDLALDLPVLLPLNTRDPLGRIELDQLGNDANVYAV